MDRCRTEGSEAARGEGRVVPDTLKQLWKEFVQLATPYGATRARLERWDALRTRARLDWNALIDADRDGQDVSDKALLKLLPHEESPSARASGAFVHVAPAVRGDLQAWFENAGWTHRQDWDDIGRGLFALVRRCVEDPAGLWQACEEFGTLRAASAFDCCMLSPILNALRPDEFLLVNANGRAVLNHFAGGSFTLKLVDYPPANARARELLQELVAVSLPPRLAGTRPGDLFEGFCHWLANESAGGLPSAPADEPAEPFARARHELLRKGQILLCGPPGSGRAELSERLAERLVAGGDGLAERLVFHAAWSYEDFIQRQLPNGGRRAGRFLTLCQAAAVRRDACVLIVHDMQRASVEAVLGEALTMLDQRGRETTLCGGGRLSIPPNLLVIGTFDTSDASAPAASLALRQRFTHVFLDGEVESPRVEDRDEGAARCGAAGVVPVN